MDGRGYRRDPNEDGITDIRFERAGEQLTVTVADGRGNHRVRCDLGGWAESVTTMTGWRLHHSYQPSRPR